MVTLVQRPRGRLGFNSNFEHLPWPKGTANIEKSLCYWQGREAYSSGVSNPYSIGTEQFQHWNLGWMRSQTIKEGL